MPEDFQLLGFDTETTGVDPFRDRIVSASTVVVTDSAEQSREWLLNPGVPIPASATAVHGIDSERAQTFGGEPRLELEQLTAHLADWLSRGYPLVVFNAPYDLTLLEVENQRHGVRPLADRLGGVIAPVIDPLVIDKQLDPRRPGGRQLSTLAAIYGVQLLNAHDALADARAAAQIAARMLKHETLRPMTVAELHSAQITWKREQQEGLANWLASQGRSPAEPISTAWPIVTAASHCM